jgi:hypothetical protein
MLSPWLRDPNIHSGHDFAQYRESTIHETDSIRRFFDDTRGEKFIISAPKGFGKTLLLIAKRKQVEENAGFKVKYSSEQDLNYSIVPSGGEIVDRPGQDVDVLKFSNRKISQIENDYYFWKHLWRISITISSLKAAGNIIEKEDSYLKKNIKSELLEMVMSEEFFTTPFQIFARICELEYARIQEIIEEAKNLRRLFENIKSQIAIFIDNIDEYFKPMQENKTSLAQHRYRGSNHIWAISQLALAGVAYEIRKSHKHIRVYCTIRREAFLRLHEFDGDVSQIRGCAIEIEYSVDDLKKIFIKNISMMPDSQLVDPKSIDPFTKMFGDLGGSIKHRFVDSREHIFDFIVRHTFGRPRDLIMIGGTFADLPPNERNYANIKNRMDIITSELVDGIYAEMRPFFDLPSIERLAAHIPSNILTRDQLIEICNEYNGGANSEESIDPKLHPFCILYRIGMLGYIDDNGFTDGKRKQKFLLPNEIVFKENLGLPREDRYFLVHPALDIRIARTSENRYFRNFHRANIIGDRLVWKEYGVSYFVAKGDIYGFSKIMESDLYDTVATKMHEWALQCCSQLEYYDVSGGDSIVMIDRSPDRLIQSVKDFIRHAATYPERSIFLRFGAAASPITFRVHTRNINGHPEQIMYPLGTALRTSARLEPGANGGTILIDERFHSLAGDRLHGFTVKELDNTNLVYWDYIHSQGKFKVRKNKTDVPYETKLYSVT